MEVLHVTSKSFGGAGKYIYVLGAGLKGRLACDVAYFPTGIPQDGDFEVAFRMVHKLPCKPSFSILSILKDIVFLKNIINRNDYKVINTHTSLGGLIGRVAVSFANKKVVVIHTLHAFGADEFTPKPQKWVYWVVEKILDKITDHYISPSQYMIGYGSKEGILAANSATVIHNSLPLKPPVNSIYFCDRKNAFFSSHNIIGDEVLLLFCGRLERQKGVDVLLRGAAKLKEETVGRFRLLICGAGDDLDALQRLANELGLGDIVIWLGWQVDLDFYYSISDIFVMSSRWESFGLVFLEAMNYSLPIVSTTVQAIPEVVLDGVTGFLGSSEDFLVLANNLKKLVDNAGLRETLGNAGNSRLKSNFLYDDFIDNHVKLYSSLCSEKGLF